MSIETSSPPNLNPSPKTRFRENPQSITEHRAILEGRSFQKSLDYALLEYQAQLGLTVSENPNMASVAGLKVTGALEFLQTFKTLSETARLPQRAPAPNLDHKV